MIKLALAIFFAIIIVAGIYICFRGHLFSGIVITGFTIGLSISAYLDRKIYEDD